jgi:hypothetical protein
MSSNEELFLSHLTFIFSLEAAQTEQPVKPITLVQRSIIQLAPGW